MRDQEGDESPGGGPVVAGGHVAVDREGVGSAAGVVVGVFHALDAAMFVTTSRTTLGYGVAGTGVCGSGG